MDLAIDIVVGLIIGVVSGTLFYYGQKRRSKEYCEYYNLDFKKFWHDELRSRIDYSNPDWDIPYIIPGKPRVFSKMEILEAEIKRRKNKEYES